MQLYTLFVKILKYFKVQSDVTILVLVVKNSNIAQTFK